MLITVAGEVFTLYSTAEKQQKVSMASSSRCKHAVRLRLMIVLGALCRPLRACTSLMVGPDATKDGSVWVAQSDDGEGAGDPRLVWVPAMDWPANSMRAVLDYENYPRVSAVLFKHHLFSNPSCSAHKHTAHVLEDQADAQMSVCSMWAQSAVFRPTIPRHGFRTRRRTSLGTYHR